MTVSLFLSSLSLSLELVKQFSHANIRVYLTKLLCVVAHIFRLFSQHRYLLGALKGLWCESLHVKGDQGAPLCQAISKRSTIN